MNSFRGSRMHVLDWVEGRWVEGRDRDFTGTLNELLRPSQAVVKPGCRCWPQGHQAPDEARLTLPCEPLIAEDLSRKPGRPPKRESRALMEVQRKALQIYPRIAKGMEPAAIVTLAGSSPAMTEKSGTRMSLDMPVSSTTPSCAGLTRLDPRIAKGMEPAAIVTMAGSSPAMTKKSECMAQETKSFDFGQIASPP